METLKNGATIIQQSGDTVLAKWKKKEYVTWKIDSEGNCYWGHYTNDILEAIKDFQERKAGGLS